MIIYNILIYCFIKTISCMEYSFYFSIYKLNINYLQSYD
nr:MAG TPA: hypothetical protein [Caudoviricetes sp.]